MVDFDDIDNWEPGLSAALSLHLPDSVGARNGRTEVR
jgi:hypothetical protein